jgi:hypothetical protein
MYKFNKEHIGAVMKSVTLEKAGENKGNWWPFLFCFMLMKAIIGYQPVACRIPFPYHYATG